jgi:CheY-like chemotaxis protein
MRILVAEDNRTNQLVFQKMVRDLAVDVVFANNGAEAVSLFQTFQPDLIFMDIAMPQMDGCQAALAIRQIEAGQQHLPIIALTALMGESDTAALGAAGIDRHMTKPLHKAALREVMIAFCPQAAYVLPPAVELARAGA